MKAKPIKIKDPPEIKTGSLLIAKPFWTEEIYQHSVILIIEHSIHGATGIILNKITDLMVHEALPEVNIYNPLYYGGPFSSRNVSYIHIHADAPGAVYLSDNLFFGGEYEFIQELINKKKFDLREIKFFSGFVKWSGGELEHEIAEDKWWINAINARELFTIPEEDLWSFKLISSGNMYGLLSEIPDPVMN